MAIEIDRQDLIDVLKAVEKKLKRDGETIGTIPKFQGYGESKKRRINVKLLRIALENGDSVSKQ